MSGTPKSSGGNIDVNEEESMILFNDVSIAESPSVTISTSRSSFASSSSDFYTSVNRPTRPKPRTTGTALNTISVGSQSEGGLGRIDELLVEVETAIEPLNSKEPPLPTPEATLGTVVKQSNLCSICNKLESAICTNTPDKQASGIVISTKIEQRPCSCLKDYFPNEGEIDFYTKQPRRKNLPESSLTETQIYNLYKSGKADPLFQLELPDVCEDVPYCNDRYTHFVHRNNLRYPDATDLCFVGDRVSHGEDEYNNYNTGKRTLGNSITQDVNKFVNIDMYRRNPTCQPGDIQQTCGRAAPGYYAQRFPEQSMWFGGTNTPKIRTILEDIGPKTRADYRIKLQNEQAIVKAKLPYISQYTEDMVLRKRPRTHLTNMEMRKLHLARKFDLE